MSGSSNPTNTRPPSSLDVLNDTEQADMMFTAPADLDLGGTAQSSGASRSSIANQTDAHSLDVEMVPVDSIDQLPLTSLTSEMGTTSAVLPLAMPLPLASSPLVATSSAPSTPSASAFTPGSYRSNRRARVDDDDDDERDRRHPSQRISSSGNSASGTPVPTSFPNTQAPSNSTASNLPTFTHLPPLAGQPLGTVTTGDGLPDAHAHPFGSLFGGLFSSSSHSNNSVSMAPPNSINSPVPASGSSSNAGPDTSRPQSQSPPEQGHVPQHQRNGYNDPSTSSIVFDYEFSIVVDRDGARPVQFHQRRGRQGRQQQQSSQGTHPQNGPPTSQQTTASAPPEAIGDQYAPPRPQSQPPSQSSRDVPPQIPQPTGVSDAGPIPNGPVPPPPMPQNLNFANIFTIPFGLGGFPFGVPIEEKEDPERARKLVEGLEKVPVGLVRRLERVGKGGGGMGEEESKGGDAGCAVCWERLLEDEATVTKMEKDEDTKMVVDEEGNEDTATKTEGSESSPTHPMIVALPCAHVFHAECLIPWFSRPKHTTCPTCRFNIDPENLTYVSAAARRRREQREQRRREGADDVNPDMNGGEETGNQPPEPAGAEGDDERGQAQPQNQQQARDADFGAAQGGFAGLLQMLNAQTRTRGHAPGPVPGTGVAPPGDPVSQTQPHLPPLHPQEQGQPIPFMAIPMPGVGPVPGSSPAPSNIPARPAGNTSNPPPNPGAAPGLGGDQRQYPGVPAGMGIGLGMQTFTIPVAGGVMIGGTIPMPWGFGSVNRGNANPATVPLSGPSTAPAGNEAAPPTNNNNSNQDTSTAPASNAPQAQQAEPVHPHPAQNQGRGQGQLPNFMADVLRITVDMVFEDPRLRPGEQPDQRQHQQGPPSDGNEDIAGDTEDHDHDESDDEDDEDGPPDLVDPMEAVAEQGRQLEELVDLIMRGGRQRRGGANTGATNAGASTENNNGTAEASQPQPQPTQEEAQPGNSTGTSHPPPPPPPPPPAFGPNRTMPMPNLGGIHIASGSGRSVGEAFTQMFSAFQQRLGGGPMPPAQAGQPGQQPMEEGHQPQPQQPAGQAQAQGPAGPTQPQQNQQQRPWQFIPVPLPADLDFLMRPPRPEGPKRPWAPPPAPGPTLRQRIERREREAGLRCHDISCGLGPSDEDPFAGEPGKLSSQLVIMSKADGDKNGKEFESAPVCDHLFHEPCLVSAQRVHLRGAEADVGEDGSVEVSCPVCRGVGCVTKEQWEEGVAALQ